MWAYGHSNQVNTKGESSESMACSVPPPPLPVVPPPQPPPPPGNISTVWSTPPIQGGTGNPDAVVGLGYSAYANQPHQQLNHDQQQQDKKSEQCQLQHSSYSMQDQNSSLGSTVKPGPDGSQMYGSYQNTTSDPYSTGYQAYNYGYSQPGNDSYSQTGPYMNAGPQYQPVNSFQNHNAYTESSYQGNSYYNNGAYQNTGGFQSAAYNGSWTEPNYSSYAYTGYAPYSSHMPTGTGSTASQSHYQQWADYYASIQSSNQSATEAAPGTETVAPTYASVTRGPPHPNNSAVAQPPPPGTQPSWPADNASYGEVGSVQDGSCWTVPLPPGSSEQFTSNVNHFHQHGQQTRLTQPQQVPLTQIQQHHFQQDPHMDMQKHVQLENQTPVKYVPQIQHPILPTGSTRPKLQIPTNPRIPQSINVSTAINSSVKISPVDSQQQMPAYVAVGVKGSNNKLSTDAVADATLKPGMFPPSLHAYVERALARCKDEAQRSATRETMKEIITKASCDGTLFSRNWDTEPLFPLPSVPSLSEGVIQNTPTVRLERCKRVSRWEPVAVEHGDKTILDGNKNADDRTKIPQQFPTKWERQNGTWLKGKPLQYNYLQQQQQQQLLTKPPKAGDKRSRKTDGTSETSSESEPDMEVGGISLGSTLTAETPEEKKRRQTRSKRFEKSPTKLGGNKGIGKVKATEVSASARRASALRLALTYNDRNGQAVEDINWDSLTVKGTCQEIEKRYLRLTSAPDPSTVRPEDVLKKALTMVQTTGKNYLYKCEQLKSIRQDLTVQRIRNEFTAEVYETHGRMALVAGDLAEYNQCQTQLRGLYAEGIKGACNEFAAYGLLYIVFQNGNNKDLLSSMARLSTKSKEDNAVRHALLVRAAVATGNYTSFFRLYRTAPNLSRYLMDLYVEKMRFEAVRCMARSYRPTIPVSFVARTLGFSSSLNENDDQDLDGLDDCEDWLKIHGSHITYDKSSSESVVDAKTTSTTLFMPEPEDAVSHGDANLAVDDFLARSLS